MATQIESCVETIIGGVMSEFERMRPKLAASINLCSELGKTTIKIPVTLQMKFIDGKFSSNVMTSLQVGTKSKAFDPTKVVHDPAQQDLFKDVPPPQVDEKPDQDGKLVQPPSDPPGKPQVDEKPQDPAEVAQEKGPLCFKENKVCEAAKKQDCWAACCDCQEYGRCEHRPTCAATQNPEIWLKLKSGAKANEHSVFSDKSLDKYGQASGKCKFDVRVGELENGEWIYSYDLTAQNAGSSGGASLSHREASKKKALLRSIGIIIKHLESLVTREPSWKENKKLLQKALTLQEQWLGWDEDGPKQPEKPAGKPAKKKEKKPQELITEYEQKYLLPAIDRMAKSSSSYFRIILWKKDDFYFDAGEVEMNAGKEWNHGLGSYSGAYPDLVPEEGFNSIDEAIEDGAKDIILHLEMCLKRPESEAHKQAYKELLAEAKDLEANPGYFTPKDEEGLKNSKPKKQAGGNIYRKELEDGAFVKIITEKDFELGKWAASAEVDFRGKYAGAFTLGDAGGSQESEQEALLEAVICAKEEVASLDIMFGAKKRMPNGKIVEYPPVSVLGTLQEALNSFLPPEKKIKLTKKPKGIGAKRLPCIKGKNPNGCGSTCPEMRCCECRVDSASCNNKQACADEKPSEKKPAPGGRVASVIISSDLDPSCTVRLLPLGPDFNCMGRWIVDGGTRLSWLTKTGSTIKGTWPTAEKAISSAAIDASRYLEDVTPQKESEQPILTELMNGLNDVIEGRVKLPEPPDPEKPGDGFKLQGEPPVKRGRGRPRKNPLPEGK